MFCCHRISVPTIVTLLIAVIFTTPSSCSPDQPARGQSDRRRTRPLQWGVYQIFWNRGYEKRLQKEIAQFDSSPAYVMFYRDLDRPFPKVAADAIHKVGATPMVSLELWRWHDSGKPYLPAIIRGDYDDYLQTWARRAREDGRRILLRFGFEFNGDWFTWSLDPDGYVAAWRRAHEMFARERANNVEWVWSPNIVSCPDTSENKMHLYYPGDSHVDWVSLDGYNFGDHHDQWHQWQSFKEIFGKTLETFEARYPSKPIILSEFGCAPGHGRQRATWIQQAYETLQDFPQVEAVIWFNYDKRREKEPNWRIDAVPGSLDAFNETFARKGP